MSPVSMDASRRARIDSERNADTTTNASAATATRPVRSLDEPVSFLSCNVTKPTTRARIAARDPLRMMLRAMSMIMTRSTKPGTARGAALLPRRAMAAIIPSTMCRARKFGFCPRTVSRSP